MYTLLNILLSYGFLRSPNSLSEALLMLEMTLKEETYQFEIRREFVLCDLLRAVKNRAYDPLKSVRVWFVGEGTLVD